MTGRSASTRSGRPGAGRPMGSAGPAPPQPEQFPTLRTSRCRRSCWNRRRSEPVDRAQDVGEQVARDRDLGHLEYDVATVADDLGADFDEFLAQRRQRPLLDGIGHSECAHEVAEVVGEGMKLEPDGVVTELAA